MHAASRIPLRSSVDGVSPPAPRTGAALEARVRGAIDAAGLTLYQIEAQTRTRRGCGLPPPISHTLYRDIRAGQTPSVAQLASLSEITQRPIQDWLTIVGVDLSALPAMQTELHEGRTIRVASRTWDAAMRVPQWERWSPHRDPRRLQRLVDVVEGESETTMEAIAGAHRVRFHYLSVGDDPWLAPELTPGSLVRVDPRHVEPRRFDRRRAIYAVAHASGISCCYAERLSSSQIALFGSPAGARPTVCRPGHDAVVLGRIDAELRCFDSERRVASTAWQGSRQAPPIVLPDPRRDTFGRFLRRSRALIGLTFRDAQALTERLADVCGDTRFRLSLGALCNYETLEQAPPSPHALFSLAAVYAMDFWDLPGVAPWRNAGHASSTRQIDATTETPAAAPASPWMQDLVRQVGEPPLWLAALRRGRPGLASITAKDVYVWGSRQKVLDPRLAGTLVLAVDQRDRRLAGDRDVSGAPPLFVLRLPNDAYICCSASIHDSCVLVHPSPALGIAPRCIPRATIDVIGRVSAVLRRLK